MERLLRLISVGIAVMAVSGPGVARAATIIWGGGTGTWGTAANWIGGATPGASDTASFTGWVPMSRAGWTVTASVGAGAAAAIDGRWGTRWTTGTNAVIGQWYRIDLGATKSFSRVVLDDTGDGSDYPPAFEVYVSSDGSTWGSPIASGTGAAPLTTINFTVQTARYIKVQLSSAGTHWWSVRESFVYTTGLTDDTQLARSGWTLSASNNSGTAGLATDSALSTRWDTGTAAAVGQWFKVDLGAAATVARVDFNAYTDANDYPPAWKVQLSTDDISYGLNVASGAGAEPFISATFAAQTARYVLITCTTAGSNYWSIHDLNVYGTPRAATLSSSTSIASLTLARSSVTQGPGAVLTVSGAYTQSAGTFTGGSGDVTLGSLSLTGGTFNAGSGAVIVMGATSVSGASSALNVGSSTVALGAFSLLNGGSFSGGMGTTIFSVGPTLTSGTFTIGTAGTTGRVTFAESTTFASGTTLVFPASGGELSVAQGKTLSLAGTVRAATIPGGTQPKIDCSGCSVNQGVTVAFESTSTLDIDGLELANSVTSGVSIASGATYTSLKRLTFRNNAGNGGSGTHLAITLGTAVINVPGCYFDATAIANVHLNGTAGQVRGARAIFEFQDATANGAGGGESGDADGDNAPGDASPGNNYGEDTGAPYYGSVVQWSAASPADTTGTAAGYPTAAFDWNTFAPYGVYASFKNTEGAGTADRLWLRDQDGSAGYSFDVPHSSGDLIGTPQWTTENEVALSLDVNGDGDNGDTSVHVVYLATTGGHVIKLVDDGASLSRPASGRWATDFTDANVVTISSPLVNDSENLYFGGTDATTTNLFGVQIAAGASEKTLVRTIGSLGAVTAALSWKRISGRVYLYAGSMATMGQAHIYRVEVSPGGYVQATLNGLTTSVNGSLRVNGSRAYAVTDGGQLYVLDSTNLGTGGFTNVPGFPYQSAAAMPIRAAAFTDSLSGLSFFGDDAGLLYSVTSSGVNATGYPYALSGAAITSSPLYLRGSGVIAVGASDGFVYFIDRHDGAGNPSLFSRYWVGTGSVSNIAYNGGNATYMVSSSDGKLSFIAKSAVTDPTPSNE